MLEAQEDVFYYVTRDERELCASRRCPTGAARRHPARHVSAARQASATVQLLGSGPILREVIAAAELLEKDWKHRRPASGASPRSPSCARDGMQAERATAPGRARRRAGSSSAWRDTKGPVDRGERLRARGGRPDPAVCAAQVRGARHRRLRPQRYACRAARFFEVDAQHIARRGARRDGARLQSATRGLVIGLGSRAPARPAWQR